MATQVPGVFAEYAYTSAEWSAHTKALPLNVKGINRDTGDIKIGDGVTLWDALPVRIYGADTVDQKFNDLPSSDTSAIEADIDALQTTVQGQTTAISGLQDSVTDLDTAISAEETAREQAFTNLQNQISVISSSLHFRPNVRAVTADSRLRTLNGSNAATAVADVALSSLLPFSDDDGTQLTQGTFLVGDYIVATALSGVAGARTALMYQIIDVGGVKTLTASGFSPLVTNDAFFTTIDLTNVGNDLETVSLYTVAGTTFPTLTKAADLKWSVATGITLSTSFVSTTGTVAASDTVEAAIAKLVGNLAAEITRATGVEADHTTTLSTHAGQIAQLQTDLDTAEATLAIVDGNTIRTTQTINVGSTRTYTTLSAALATLSGKRISSAAPVSIVLDAEDFTESAAIVYNHPDGINITITGNTTTHTVSAYGTVTGSAGAWSIPITLDTVVGLRVGSYLQISYNASNDAKLTGAWEVTAIDTTNKIATVTCLCSHSVAPVGVAGSTGTVYGLNTRISRAGSIFTVQPGYLKLTGVVLRSTNASGNGVGVGQYGYALLQKCCITKNSVGINVSGIGAGLNAIDVAITGTTTAGLNIASTAYVTTTTTSINGNTGYGINATTGGACYSGTTHVYGSGGSSNPAVNITENGIVRCSATCRVAYNAGDGVYVSNGLLMLPASTFIGNNTGVGLYMYMSKCNGIVVIQSNGGRGVEMHSGSTAVLTGTIGSNSGTTDLYAIDYSFLDATGVSSGSPTLSPAANTAGNNSSYIKR